MLSRDRVIAHYIFAFCFFFLSGSELITGWPATISGVMGTIEFTTALLWYSPLYDLAEHLKAKAELRKVSLQNKLK